MLDGHIRPTKTPDADNIAKSVLDALNKVAYKDDSCVVDLIVEKWYSENPRVEVYIWFEWKRDNPKIYPKIHPTQKPVGLLKQLIEIFTDEGDVVIDPCAGSGTTLRACAELNRNSYGFEISREFYNKAMKEMLAGINAPDDDKWENMIDCTGNQYQQYKLV